MSAGWPTYGKNGKNSSQYCLNYFQFACDFNESAILSVPASVFYAETTRKQPENNPKTLHSAYNEVNPSLRAPKVRLIARRVRQSLKSIICALTVDFLYRPGRTSISASVLHQTVTQSEKILGLIAAARRAQTADGVCRLTLPSRPRRVSGAQMRDCDSHRLTAQET